METVVTSKIIANIFASYDSSLTVESFEIRKVTEHAHFLSFMFSVSVHLQRKINDLEVERFTRKIMFKTIPRNPLRIKYIQDGKHFVKEALMYSKVFPNVFAPLGLLSFPEVMHTFCDGQADYIAMEDLTPKGYITIKNRLSGFDLDHTILVIKELAKFHAASFLKYGGDAEKMQNDYPDMKEYFWDEPEETAPEMNQLFISNSLRDILKMLKSEKLEHFIPKVNLEMGKALSLLPKLTTPSHKFPSVINHGDCWITNVMFNYSDDKKECLKGLKFVDFQLARTTSRCTDLSYLIYTSINTTLLNEKLDELLKLYYDSFNEFCESNEIPLTFKGEKLTWDYFLQEWEFYRHFGLISGLMLIPLMYSDPNDVPNLELMDESDLKSETDHFSKMWDFKPMREKLVNLISRHLS